jgi:hypothetical protein
VKIGYRGLPVLGIGGPSMSINKYKNNCVQVKRKEEKSLKQEDCEKLLARSLLAPGSILSWGTYRTRILRYRK